MSVTADENSPPHDLFVGPYRLLARIGEGGMGVVHLGQRPGGPRVAIKVLRPHVVSDDEARARLAREVNSLSRVHSPRVAEIVDSDPWGPVPYVATRYVPGLALHQYVQEEGALDGEALTHFARGLAEAIHAVHRVGVLHRDIKPSNVLMEGRNPVLIDFGLARLDDDARVTRTGYLLGTPGYLAPEILFGQEPTSAADVHSWAATVAFAGTGRPPFGAGHPLAVMDRVRRGDHDVAGLDPAVAGWVLAALDPDPVRRPTLAQLLHSLDATATVERPAVVGEAIDAPAATMPFAASPDHWATTPVDATGATRVEDVAPTRVDPPQPAPQPAPQPGRFSQPPGPFAQPPAAFPEPTPMSQPARAPYQVPPAATPVRVTWSERFRRWMLGFSAIVAVAGAAAWAPWLTVVGATLVVTVLRAGSLTGSALSGRRAVRGRKWWDSVVTTFTAPWHLLVSMFGTIALLVWAAMLVCCVLLVGVAGGLSDGASLAAAGVVMAASLWTGPGSSRIRSPMRRVGLPIARSTGAWAVWSLLLLLVGGGLLALGAAGPEWFPAQQAPWAPGTWLGRWL